MQSISLSYIAPSDLYTKEKPYGFNVVVEDIPEHLQSNLVYDVHNDVPLKDARSLADDFFTYEEQGFKFISHPESATYELDRSPVGLQRYCSEMIKFVSKEFQADACFAYDVRFRKSDVSSSHYKSSEERSRDLIAPPVFHAHIDHTKISGFDRIKRHLTDVEAEQYLSDKYRARIVNIWRPLYHAAEDTPLAYCDARTVSEHDVLAADRVHPDFVFELYYLKYNEQQKWYWLSHQTPDDMAVFIQFDSESVSAPGFKVCPHASFHNAHAAVDAPLRESIELRFAVFTLKSDAPDQAA